jgi:hypothetical protein
MNPIDYILIGILAVGLIGVVVYLIKEKKKGNSGCGCGCSGCPHANACNSAQKSKEEEDDA